MIEQRGVSPIAVPSPRVSAESSQTAAEPDHRPRMLRWLLPTACSSAVPLDGMQQAELKLIAYH